MFSSAEFQMDDTTADFLVPEGFARVTRNGVSDIYVVQNQEYPGDYKVSLAFPLDDFEPNNPRKTYGEPLLLGADDEIHFLGTPQNYFLPKAPLWEQTILLVKRIPKELGLLPTVRVVEQLKMLERQPTKDEISAVVELSIADYHYRRAMLIA